MLDFLYRLAMPEGSSSYLSAASTYDQISTLFGALGLALFICGFALIPMGESSDQNAKSTSEMKREELKAFVGFVSFVAALVVGALYIATGYLGDQRTVIGARLAEGSAEETLAQALQTTLGTGISDKTVYDLEDAIEDQSSLSKACLKNWLSKKDDIGSDDLLNVTGRCQAEAAAQAKAAKEELDAIARRDQKIKEILDRLLYERMLTAEILADAQGLKQAQNR